LMTLREPQSMVNVIDVDAVIDEVAVSFPVIVTVYVPLGATPEEDEEDDVDALEQPFKSPAAIRNSEQPATRSSRERRPPQPISAIAANAKPNSVNPSNEPGQSLRVTVPACDPASFVLPLASVFAAVPHADELVLIVRLAVTADVPETVALAMEKHILDEEGPLEMAHAMVPVYPFCGVIVTVDVPVRPAATVTLVADKLKPFVAVEPLQALNRLLKSSEPRPVARS
jgi:hypothetical protein